VLDVLVFTLLVQTFLFCSSYGRGRFKLSFCVHRCRSIRQGLWLFCVPEDKQRQITLKTSAHLLCAPIRSIYRGGRRHHADMSVVVPITLSCRPVYFLAIKITWNISATDIAAEADTDFVGACTTTLTEQWTVQDSLEPHLGPQLSILLHNYCSKKMHYFLLKAQDITICTFCLCILSPYMFQPAWAIFRGRNVSA
jgi:hypothetical protein